MDISLKKVFSNNYASRFWLIISIFAPIFGICVLLSVVEVLPKFPLTENMSIFTAVLIMLGCIAIMILGIIITNNMIANLQNIISNGKITMAVITDVIASKHQVLVKYEFKYDEETFKGNHNLAKKLDYKADYAKGKELKIYAFKNSDGKMLTTPDIY